MAYDKQYLYRLTFPNGMVYIGSTSSIKRRWTANGYKYRGQAVYEHIVEFGWDNIQKEVLLHLPASFENSDKIERLEREFIKVYGDRCYNKQANPIYVQEATERQRTAGLYEPTVLWTIDGVTKPAKDWCAEKGASYATITRRMKVYNISPCLALSLPSVPLQYSRHAKEYWESQGFKIE